ncbi:predicted protein [Pediculus humanus corporis]|uniref:Predicted protein n=1 Tax=Pediculus humanus subsp. corporis TaxID=121224 RepID=E0VDP9_PEDHC|nr:uncharacterized protein Phum_PHUM122670 [Pediculus humanus corporis]EEB11505.1 predicted protein [Pediculus humanus corporis]
MFYENPNYHLDPARLDDALNSNLVPNVEDDLYEEIINELDAVCNLPNRGRPGSGCEGRKSYASLDVTSMGVDVNTGPVTNLDSNKIECNNRSFDSVKDTSLDNSFNYNNLNMGRRPNDLNAIVRTKPDLIEDAEYRRNKDISQINSLQNSKIDLEDVSNLHNQLTDDLFAVPVKRASQSPTTDTQDTPDKDRLPPGWEKHEDNDGPYYWHIKSGTIQREPPEECKEISTIVQQFLKDTEDLNSSTVINCVTRSNTSSALESINKKEDLAYKRRSYPARVESSDSKQKPIRFAVRSLGWVEIAEEDLTPERSSKAVNKCIVDLSLGRNDLLDVVGRWGDGKDLFMDLDEGSLKLMDPEKLTVLNSQPIHTIRVWGVGRDNGRDFAYVARDKVTRRHMCHVFRCDISARTIANTLRDICKKIMIERSLQQNLAKPVDINNCGRQGLAVRPTNLPTENRRHQRNGGGLSLGHQSFPTPMEEPKKILKAQYLGSCQVNKATGMDILNEAIDQLSHTPEDTWINVSIAVAPSMISISPCGDENSVISECRVRYLSFLGIGQNVKLCGFIMHTAQDLFIAHVFHCEPSSGALCKTIEAACKLRYQKCLDAHPQGIPRSQSGSQTPGKSIGAALKSFVGSLTGRKARGGSESS